MRENDVKAIQAVYADFLKAWETGDSEWMGKCLKETPFAYVSMFEKPGYMQDQLKKWFVNPGPEGSALKIQPLQSTVYTLGSEAQQYAVVLGEVSKGEKHISFGGSFMNHYEKVDGCWVLETIRFQLQSDDGFKSETLDAEGIVHRESGTGDRSLLGEWLGVDERVGAFQDKIEHSGNTVITPEIDAPWRVIRTPDNCLSDEEAIIDVLCRTSCAYDYLAMTLAVPAFHESARVDVGGMFGEMNRRDALTYVKEMRKGMPRCFSGLQMENLLISGDSAEAVLKVLAPECRTVDGSFLKDTYTVSFVKADGRWSITRLLRQ